MRQQTHYSDHRYIVSEYVRRPDDFDILSYYRVDRFMTVRSYNDPEHDDVLGTEKQEIVTRLRR